MAPGIFVPSSHSRFFPFSGHRCVSVQWRLSKLNEGGSDTATVVFLSPGSHHEAAQGGCWRKALGRLRQVRRAAESAVSEVSGDEGLTPPRLLSLRAACTFKAHSVFCTTAFSAMN